MRVSGLPWWGARPPIIKKLFVGEAQGEALKFGQVLVNVFRKRFARRA